MQNRETAKKVCSFFCQNVVELIDVATKFGRYLKNWITYFWFLALCELARSFFFSNFYANCFWFGKGTLRSLKRWVWILFGEDRISASWVDRFLFFLPFEMCCGIGVISENFLLQQAYDKNIIALLVSQFFRFDVFCKQDRSVSQNLVDRISISNAL